MKKFYVAILLLVMAVTYANAQVAGDFRSRASGNWSDIATWETYDGAAWANATVAPTAVNNVYLQRAHTITLTQNADCKDLNLMYYTETRLALSSYSLNINGKIASYSSAVNVFPVVYSIPAGSAIWITRAPSGGILSFVGNTRDITVASQWSAGTAGGTFVENGFELEINLNAGQIATANTGIKARNIRVNSGTLQVVGGGRLAPDQGAFETGNFTIASGATVISDATGTNGNAVIGRSTNASSGYGALFTNNGKLILTGLAPTLGMNSTGGNGTIEYSAAGNQTLLVSTGGATGNVLYTNLVLSGSGTKTFPSIVVINGNFIINGAATANASATTVTFSGASAQYIAGTTFNSILFSNVGVKTLTGDVMVNTVVNYGAQAVVLNLSIFNLSRTSPGGTFMLANGHTMQISGDNFPSNFDTYIFNSGSTVNFNGTVAQSIPGYNYGNLTLSNGTTFKNLTGNATVAGNLTVTNANVNLGEYTLNSVSNPVTGTFAMAGGQLNVLGADNFPRFNAYNLSGGNVVNYAATAVNQAVYHVPVYRNLSLTGFGEKTPSGNLTVNSSLYTLSNYLLFDMGTNTVGGNATSVQINPNVIIRTAGSFLNFPLAAAATIISNASTVEYNGSSAQNVYIPSPANLNFAYGNLVLSGSGTKTLPAATTSIAANLTVAAGTPVNANGGTLNFTRFGPQTITGVLDAYNVNIANGSTGNVSVTTGAGNMLNIYNALTFTGAGGAGETKLNTNGNVTLKSNATGTAYIGNQNGFVINGNVNVERYVNSATNTRRWRLLTLPVSGATVAGTWGQGTIINDPVNNATGTNGYDASPAGVTASSIREFSADGTALSTPASLNAANPAGKAYFLFVRGDRTIAPGANSTDASDATLPATNTVNQGTVTLTGALPATGFAAVGNPYAAPISFSSITYSGGATPAGYKLWDPAVGTSGGYVDFNPDGTLAAGSSPSFSNGTIQSGQAFLVAASGAQQDMIFTEAGKTTTTNNVLRTSGTASRLDIWFYKKDGAGNFVYTDAAAAHFDNAYSKGYSAAEDVNKSGNFNENISLLRDGKYISVERAARPAQDDTLYLQQWKLANATYKLEVHADNTADLIPAFIKDNYLGTTIPVNMSGITGYEYSVDLSMPASVNISRFQIVFKQAAALPVSFTNIKAYQKSNGVGVEWSVANESGIANYEAEKSADAVSFTKFSSASAKNINNSSYTAFDAVPNAGVNYYRVKSIAQNGAVKYTSLVKVILGSDGKPQVTAYPNPVKGGVVGLSFNNLAKGLYTIALFSADGKQVAAKQINHNGANASATLSLPNGIAKGVYQLQVTGATTLTQQVVVE